MTTTQPLLSERAPLVRHDMGARRRRVQRKTVSYLILAFFGAFYLGPLAMLIGASSKTLPEFFKDPTGLPEGIEHQNYTEAWGLANFPSYIVNSLIYTVVATTLFVLMSVFVAFPIARGYVRGAGSLLMLYVVALFLPPALIPQFQLILNFGDIPVVGDLFFPWQAEAGFLHTREHFEHVRRLLRPGGVFCQWIPGHQMGWEEIGVIGGRYT